MSALHEELQARARKALAAWGLPDQEPELLKYRENAVFKVRLRDGQDSRMRSNPPSPTYRVEPPVSTRPSDPHKGEGLTQPHRRGSTEAESMPRVFSPLVGGEKRSAKRSNRSSGSIAAPNAGRPERVPCDIQLPCGEDGKAALRLHRPGYHSEVALRSELQWMADLRRNGLAVPQPIAALDGSLLVSLNGTEPQFADLIGWVEGRQIGEGSQPLDRPAEEVARIYRSLGAIMAQMHDIADRWTPPHGFSRPAWDDAGLLGDKPLWGRFWDCAGLSIADAAFLADLRLRLQRRLDAVAAGLDYGLIHADMVRENVLVDGENIAVIDFDDSGFGFRLFDIATALLRCRRDPHYDLIKASLIAGYRSHRSLSDQALSHLPLFLLLRGLTYIGWVGDRPDLPDASERMARYIADVRELAGMLEEPA